MDNPLNNKNEHLQNIKPIPNIRERNRNKLLQESDKIFDDLELYGLVLTNDLLKIRRHKKKINKNDFTLEYNSFRKRLYTNIDNTGDKMVNSIKNITSEFESVNGSILSYFKRVLNCNTRLFVIFSRYFFIYYIIFNINIFFFHIIILSFTFLF